MLVIKRLGIHSTNIPERLSVIAWICLSTSPPDTDSPRYRREPVRNLPFFGLPSQIKDLGSNRAYVSSFSFIVTYFDTPRAMRGAYPWVMKCNLGKGIRLVQSFLTSELFCIPGNLIVAVAFDIA
jgi:hypothetical protein